MKSCTIGSRAPRGAWLVLATAIVLGLGYQPGRASTVLVPSATTVAPGDDFSIELDDASFDPSSILGVDVDVTFDPTVLTWDSVTVGSWLPGGSVLFNPVPGGDVSICCWMSGGVGNSVFTAFFSVLSTANPGPHVIPTTISFSTDPSADPDTEYLVDPDPSSAMVQIAPSSMVVIPEPTTGTLVLIGVVGTMFAGRMLRLAPSRSS